MSGETFDTFGCPVFWVDASAIEVMGSNIRLSFGVKRGDRIEGAFSMVMTAEFAVACSQVCQQVSLEAAFRALGGSDARVIAH